MVDNAKMARKLGYLDIPDTLLVTADQAKNMDDSEVVLMCTGSQGEPTSILGRLSMGTHRSLEIKDGDTVVLSSHPIPGNEEIVYRTINRLFQLRRQRDLRSHRPGACLRARQPGRDETDAQPGAPKVFSSPFTVKFAS